jgi:hypothetical protein
MCPTNRTRIGDPGVLPGRPSVYLAVVLAVVHWHTDVARPRLAGLNRGRKRAAALARVNTQRIAAGSGPCRHGSGEPWSLRERQIRPALLRTDAETASKLSYSRPNRPSPSLEAHRFAFETPRRSTETLSLRFGPAPTAGLGLAGHRMSWMRSALSPGSRHEPPPAGLFGQKVDTRASSGVPESGRDIMSFDPHPLLPRAVTPECLTKRLPPVMRGAGKMAGGRSFLRRVGVSSHAGGNSGH